MAGDFAITEYQPDRVLGFEVTAGPVRPTGRFALVALGPARTAVTFTMDVTPTRGMRLMSTHTGAARSRSRIYEFIAVLPPAVCYGSPKGPAIRRPASIRSVHRLSWSAGVTVLQRRTERTAQESTRAGRSLAVAVTAALAELDAQPDDTTPH